MKNIVYELNLATVLSALSNDDDVNLPKNEPNSYKNSKRIIQIKSSGKYIRNDFMDAFYTLAQIYSKSNGNGYALILDILLDYASSESFDFEEFRKKNPNITLEDFNNIKSTLQPILINYHCQTIDNFFLSTFTNAFYLDSNNQFIDKNNNFYEAQYNNMIRTLIFTFNKFSEPIDKIIFVALLEKLQELKIDKDSSKIDAIVQKGNGEISSLLKNPKNISSIIYSISYLEKNLLNLKDDCEHYAVLYYLMSHKYVDSDMIDTFEDIFGEFLRICPKEDKIKFFNNGSISSYMLYSSGSDNDFINYYKNNEIDGETLASYVPHSILIRSLSNEQILDLFKGGLLKKDDIDDNTFIICFDKGLLSGEELIQFISSPDVLLSSKNASKVIKFFSLEQLIECFNNSDKFNSKSTRVLLDELKLRNQDIKDNYSNISSPTLLNLTLTGVLPLETFKTFNIPSEKIEGIFLSEVLSPKYLIKALDMNLINENQLISIYTKIHLEKNSENFRLVNPNAQLKLDEIISYFSVEKLPEFLDNEQIVNFYLDEIISKSSKERAIQQGKLISSIKSNPENSTANAIDLYFLGVLDINSLLSINMDSSKIEALYKNESKWNDLMFELYKSQKISVFSLAELDSKILLNACTTGKLPYSVLKDIFSTNELLTAFKTGDLSTINILELYYNKFLTKDEFSQFNINISEYIEDSPNNLSGELAKNLFIDQIIDFNDLRKVITVEEFKNYFPLNKLNKFLNNKEFMQFYREIIGNTENLIALVLNRSLDLRTFEAFDISKSEIVDSFLSSSLSEEDLIKATEINLLNRRAIN